MRSQFRSPSAIGSSAALLCAVAILSSSSPAWAQQSCLTVSYKGSTFDSTGEARRHARYQAGVKAGDEARVRMIALAAGRPGWTCRVLDVRPRGESCSEVLGPQVGTVKRKFYACAASATACYQCFPPPRIWAPGFPGKK